MVYFILFLLIVLGTEVRFTVLGDYGSPQLTSTRVCTSGYFNDTIKIGVPIGMTSTDTKYVDNLAIRRGLEMIQHWLLYKSDGIKVGDDKWGLDLFLVESFSSAEATKNITNKFISDKSVDIMFSSTQVESVVPLTEKNKLLLLYPNAGGYSSFTNLNFNYSYRIQPPPGTLFKGLDTFAGAGAKTVTYICDYSVCNRYNSINGDSGVTNSETTVKNLIIAAGLDVRSYLQADFHDDSENNLDGMAMDIQTLDSDLLIIDDSDCSEILSKLYHANYFPRGIFLTDCGGSVSTSSLNIDYITSFKILNTDSTVKSGTSGLSPAEWVDMYQALYFDTPPNEAVYTFTLGEVLVSAIEKQATLDRTLCKNSTALTAVISSEPFYTILSEEAVTFSGNNMGTEVVPLAQRDTAMAFKFVDSSSLVYPNPQSIVEEPPKTYLLDLLYKKGFAFLPTMIVAFIFFAVSFRIYTMRENLSEDEKKEVIPLKFAGVPGFTVRGFGLSSEFFLVIDMLANSYLRSGLLIVCFRSLHTFLSSWYIYKMFGRKNSVIVNAIHSTKEIVKEKVLRVDHAEKKHRVEEDGERDGHFAVSALISRERMLKANKLYSFVLFLSFFDAQALILLPWKPSQFADISGGTPNLKMASRLLFVTVFHSICVTTIQLMFLRENYENNMPAVTRALFILNAMGQITIASVNCVSYFTKITLLDQKQRELNFALEHRSVINEIAATNLEGLQAYKDDPEGFMKKLQAMFAIRETLSTLTSDDGDDDEEYGFDFGDTYDADEAVAAGSAGNHPFATTHGVPRPRDAKRKTRRGTTLNDLMTAVSAIEKKQKKAGKHKHVVETERTRQKKAIIAGRLMEVTEEEEEEEVEEGGNHSKKESGHKHSHKRASTKHDNKHEHRHKHHPKNAESVSPLHPDDGYKI